MRRSQVEATGETVGEAKWAALRELEKQHPGLDKAAVRFQVVSEGERGLLGVGYAPARVIATVSADAVRGPDASRTRASSRPRHASSWSGSSTRSASPAAIDVEEDDETITVACSGADLGMLIGRHGQTIDAVQYLANAVMYRRHRGGPEGGRRRRGRLPRAAAGVARKRWRCGRRSAASGAASAIELEPMTAVERKVVHLRLKEFDGVETTSEGTEPNRFVVIVRRRAACHDPRASAAARRLAARACRDAAG